MANQLRDIDKEREIHKHEEATRHFIALLADFIKQPNVSWKEAKKLLKKDSRFEFLEILSREEREHLFNEHMEQLMKRKRNMFREILDDAPDVMLTSTWKDVKKHLRNNCRFEKLQMSSEKVRIF